jgi:hypothetical protein
VRGSRSLIIFDPESGSAWRDAVEFDIGEADRAADGIVRRILSPALPRLAAARAAMNILLTGSSGWLGRFLAPLTARQGHEVTASTSRRASTPM